MSEVFCPIPGQMFKSHKEWVRHASSWLTSHPEYLNTEHDGPAKGWRGHHFTAMCFDQKGRRCRNGGDMRIADEEGAFPVWWVWPDQIADLLMTTQAADAYAAQLKAEAIAAKLAWVLRRVINDEHWRTTDNTLWPNATAALAEYEASK